MSSKQEQALVGLFVACSTAALIAAVVAIHGFAGRGTRIYYARFGFGGWLEPGTGVRYAGGPTVGRVEKIYIDPQDPSRIDIQFSVRADVPVKIDTLIKIMSTSPLGDNHLEMLPGSPAASDAPNGARLRSQESADLNSLIGQASGLLPQVQQLLASLNARATELKETIDRANDLLDGRNRANVAATLANLRGLVSENRPELSASLRTIDAATHRLEPLIAAFQQTAAEAGGTLGDADRLIDENRADLRATIAELKRSATNLSDASGRIDRALDVNAVNIDELLENLRETTENLSQFTDTIRTRPSSLIRSASPPEHTPGVSR